MFLGGLKCKARGFESGFTAAELKAGRLTPVQLLELVFKLRKRDFTVVNQIVMHHMSLVVQITGRYVKIFPNRAEDLISFAMVHMVDSINKFPEVARDNNITGYVVTCLHGHLGNYLKEEGIVHLPKRQYLKTKISNKYSELKDDKVTIDDHSQLEVDELFAKVSMSRIETIICKKLMEGESEVEIARHVGYTRAGINNLKKKIIIKLTVALNTETIEDTVELLLTTALRRK